MDHRQLAKKYYYVEQKTPKKSKTIIRYYDAITRKEIDKNSIPEEVKPFIKSYFHICDLPEFNLGTLRYDKLQCEKEMEEIKKKLERIEKEIKMFEEQM